VTVFHGAAISLLAALIYTAASLFLKGALERRATSSQVNVAVNVAMALIVQPLWLLGRPDIPNAPLWQPLLCSLIFFLGQILTFAALSRGDVSLATPLLGTKILFVTAINTLFFQTPASLRWWIAAVAASVSVALIAGGRRSRTHALGFTVACSLAAAACYSLTDVLIQHWGDRFDSAAFPPVMFGAAGVISVIFYSMRDRSAFRPPAASRPLLALGAVLFGVQIVLFFFSLVWTRDATLSNVVYSSRTVWSVVAAWTAGHFLGLRDVEAGAGVMQRRLLGSFLLFGAILLILL
jgi:drug/metabolite transporter (DMT)-like permease